MQDTDKSGSTIERVRGIINAHTDWLMPVLSLTAAMAFIVAIARFFGHPGPPPPPPGIDSVLLKWLFGFFWVVFIVGIGFWVFYATKLKEVLRRDIVKKSLTTLAVLFIAWLVLFLVIELPQIQTKDYPSTTSKERTDKHSATDSHRITIIHGLGGLAALVAAILAFRRMRATERQLEATEDGQVTERYTKAIEQLGSENMAVRLGGIYALERIANECDIEKKNDYWTVMEVLTAFLRMNSQANIVKSETSSKVPIKPAESQDQENDLGSPCAPLAADLLAIVEVIRRRKYSYNNGESFPLDLSKTNLHAANFTEANLHMAKFIMSDLTGADFTNGNLSGAKFSGGRFTGADFLYADLTNARFFDVDLTRAFFLDANLTGAVFSRVDLKNAELIGGDFSMARFNAADLSGATLFDADLTKTNLNKTKLIGTKYDKTTKFPDGFKPEEHGMVFVEEDQG
ncbi:pentapeptide repeat-containing protein [Desulfatibacillum aliphaticivorans]|uniref:pentapeptide repeat-containing protein n=1 Tax=Desulfatibacillum aliphaticivorans TaxID=218208 RepID=UPI000405BD96|nr:pentapeptide repeat-containing protein [Desulfatibacillum aliphaticivorans]